ncbi:hypothetical protein [Thermosipho atlanticus]|uniref:Uncharacterized protein n=1 Tax=Thermosipho atlanticus DSM 15807 TaxID=1123380 RepID=A0A1M5QR33_9BACT|nr:hypothetical protein [Thermosipho atlanticus]SHH16574.1 hypothetical protein SAMN02745199_0096 [Thermosipho atlanticus DSM 15807]
MIFRWFLWLFPLVLISFDRAFLDYLVLIPLIFYFESVNKFGFGKALRYVIYLSFYVIVIYGEYNLLFAMLIFLIVLIDSMRELWLKIWVVPLIESGLFLLPLIFEGYDYSYFFSMIISFVVFLILYRKKIILYK